MPMIPLIAWYLISAQNSSVGSPPEPAPKPIVWLSEGRAQPAVDLLTEKGSFSPRDRYTVSISRVGEYFTVLAKYNEVGYTISIKGYRFPRLDVDKRSISPLSRHVPAGGILITIPFGEEGSCDGASRPSTRASLTLEILPKRVAILEKVYADCVPTLNDIGRDPGVIVTRWRR